MAGGAGHKQVRHLGEVNHEDLVGDCLAKGYGQVVCRFLKLFAVEDALHRDDVRVLVGNFNTNCSLTGYRRDDADPECAQAECDVVFEILDFVDAHALCRGYLIERHGGADGRLDA